MKLNSIQFLRAVAVILIVYASSIDLTAQFGKSYQQSFYYLRQLGNIGIDLFFVISGFVITYVASNYSGSKEGLQFLQKRFFRINPIYYIASILFFGVQYFKIWATDSLNGFLLKFNSIPGLVDTLWVVPTSDSLSHFKPYLLAGWSLSFAWLFYILFFIVILTRVRNKMIALLSVIGLLIIAGYLIKPTDLRLTFITNAIMLEFLLGVAICQLYLHVKRIPKYIPILLLLTGMAWYIALIFYNYGTIWAMPLIMNGSLSLNRFLLWGIPNGCIIAGCVFLEKNGLLNRVWNNKVSNLIGDASYSIFLIHLTVFTLLHVLYKHINTLLLPDIGIIVQIIIAVGIGIIFYWYGERSLLKWLHKPSRRTARSQTPAPKPQSA